MADDKMHVAVRFQAKAHERADGEGWDLELITSIGVGDTASDSETSWFGPFPTRATALEQAHCIRAEMQARLDARMTEIDPKAAPGLWLDNKKRGAA